MEMCKKCGGEILRQLWPSLSQYHCRLEELAYCDSCIEDFRKKTDAAKMKEEEKNGNRS